ncbi:uncharacterized protein LOC113780492 [Coffea eugenioides]|nr:uncharacterized protein LOC113780492 [Coffea eugenioides]
MVIGRSKRQVFGYIKEKVVSRMRGWKEKVLSQTGKEIMLKSIILALPTYAMSCCKLPKSLCMDLCRQMAKFRWGDSEEAKRIHWISWDKLSEVKGKGGLGFRDLQCFNKATLAKQLWRVLTNPSLLVRRVLKNRYFKGTSIWETKERGGHSWIWKSILSAGDLLEKGARKRVGDGSTINIWKDKWIMNSTNGMVQSRKPEGC